jgi:flagellin-like protein
MMDMKGEEKAVAPVVAEILLVAITVILAAVLYIVVMRMTIIPPVESVGGTITKVSDGWVFSCTSGTRDFHKSMTYISVQSEIGESKIYTTLLQDCNGSNGITFYDNNNDHKLNAGDTIYIQANAGDLESGDVIQIVYSTKLIFNRALP